MRAGVISGLTSGRVLALTSFQRTSMCALTSPVARRRSPGCRRRRPRTAIPRRATSSGSTSALCPAGRWSCGSLTGPNSARPSTTTSTASSTRHCRRAAPPSRRNGLSRFPPTTSSVLKTAVPEAVAAAGVDPASVIGIATDFTASTPLPVTADGTPLCELPEFADRPHAYVKLWKHHAAQGQADRINDLARERAESWLPRYGGLHLQRVGVRQGSPAARGGPRGLRAHRALGRGRRLDHLAALRPLRPQRMHRRLQGHLPGRRLPEPRLPRRSQPRLRRLRRDQGRARDRASGRRRRHADRRGRSVDRPPRGHRRRGRQRRRARHRTRRAGRRARSDARDHGHQHLPRDERPAPRRGPRDVRRGRRRHRRRALGLRGRASPASATSSPGTSRTRCQPGTSRMPRRPARASIST